MAEAVSETYCNECGELLPWPVHEDRLPRTPCPACGGTRRRYALHLSDTVTVIGNLIGKAAQASRDRRLPGRGLIRFYSGRRVGRDGRLVERTASYNPYADVAAERVVDAETGEVIVDKSESMREKYQREGRWKPRDGA
jgi:hypothetical protein